MNYFIPLLSLFVLVLSAGADTLSLFSGRNIASQTRGWNGPKDASATVTVSFENDSLVVKAVVNDDQTSQGSEDEEIVNGDHVQLWLAFDGKPNIHLGFSPGQRGHAKPVCVLWEASGRTQILESTPPTVLWNNTGYELDAVIPLADLRLDPDARPKTWAAALGDTDREPGQSMSVLRDLPKPLRYFTAHCRDTDLKILATEKVKPDEIESRMSQLIRFQEAVQPRERFDGVLFDLGLLDPSTATDDFARRLTQAAQQWRRQFKYCEFWVALPNSLMDKKTGRFRGKIFELADQVIVMSSGTTESDWTNVLKPAIESNQPVSKPFWIGITIRSGEDRPSLNHTQLEQSFAEFGLKTRGIAEFRGFAINDYRNYRKLDEAVGSTQPAGDARPRALWTWCAPGLADSIMVNDYFQREFFRFCNAPFGQRKSNITHLLFDVGEFTRGPKGAEILLRFPEGFKPDDSKTWATYK